MRVLHITHQGAEVRLSGQTLGVWHEGKRLLQARLPLLRSIVLHGAVHASPAAWARILAEGIDCVYLTQGGRFHGRLETLSSTAAQLRVLQAQRAAHPASRLTAARAVVRNAILSRWRILRAFHAQPARPLDWLLAGHQEAGNLAELQGLEGYATRLYFHSLRTVLPTALARWRRQRRPPPDGLNALLSYGYAILQSRVHAAVAVVGMDPFIGFLHELGRPRPAFVLDMMEEFRAPVVDFTCFRLISAWGPDGWWEATPGGARLSDDARRQLITRIEERLAATTVHAGTNTRVTLERAIELQVRAFASGLRGDWSRYRPLKGAPA